MFADYLNILRTSSTVKSVVVGVGSLLAIQGVNSVIGEPLYSFLSFGVGLATVWLTTNGRIDVGKRLDEAKSEIEELRSLLDR